MDKNLWEKLVDDVCANVDTEYDWAFLLATLAESCSYKAENARKYWANANLAHLWQQREQALLDLHKLTVTTV